MSFQAQKVADIFSSDEEFFLDKKEKKRNRDAPLLQEVALKSGKLKGGFVRLLREAALKIEVSADTITQRAMPKEDFNAHEVEELRVEMRNLREDLAQLKAERNARATPFPSSPPLLLTPPVGDSTSDDLFFPTVRLMVLLQRGPEKRVRGAQHKEWSSDVKRRKRPAKRRSLRLFSPPRLLRGKKKSRLSRAKRSLTH
ncbi:hypothetical protein PUN28_020823 [Cardiocondyla obscurior]|uniref:Uncharacterized protein n=1 Tax=Cardiocondyla obscurior TaxID=286306 RepID=A0AAW2E7G4_9HYME